MPIHHIASEPITVKDLPLRLLGFNFYGAVPEKAYEVGTPGFFFWQCREAALDTWEYLAGPLERCQLAREGRTLVSGHASGVDVTSHRAALAEGGTTILVLPLGQYQFRLRPELPAVWDWRRALVVSPYEPQADFKPFRAIQRNAVIAGLSQGVIVFEAGNLGGTLNTGLTTLKLKKPLFAAIYEELPPTATGNSSPEGPPITPTEWPRVMEQAATRIAVSARID